jgi:NADP-dependent 3-hydroxy acid dehydrogenase YdfG
LNDDFDGNAKKHVIIYGACSHMGRITTSIFVKHGYSVVLIDVNLEKLQDLRLNIARTHCEQFTEETLN